MKSHYRNMKPLLICVILLLTTLGTSSASGNTDNHGLHVVDETKDLFRPRIVLEENLIQENGINFTITTSLLHGENEDNFTGNSSSPRPKTGSEEQSIETNKALGWMVKTLNTLYDVMICVFGWTKLPHDINANIFDKRSVTMAAVHSTTPGQAKSEQWAHNLTTSDSSWFSPVFAATGLCNESMEGIYEWLGSVQFHENAHNLIHYYWTNWKNWSWQDTFDVLIMLFMINYCTIALYLTMRFVGNIIRLLRNYHVWNECWFKRNDLPDGHDGWQAIDGTPQETSGKYFQCGPASVIAIKNGEVYLNYDTDFIFAEVNADRCYWEADYWTSELTLLQLDKGSTGKYISTAKPKETKVRRDLTNHYKHREGSDEERRVVEFVNKFSTKSDLPIYESAVKDVTCKLDVVDEVSIGDDFKATATLKNESGERRTVNGHFTAILVYYTGRAAKSLKDETTSVVLEPGEEIETAFGISTPELIGKSAIPEASIKVFMRGSVKETDQRFAKQDIVEFMKPELEVKFSSLNVPFTEEVTVTVSVTNPLSVDLTNGNFQFEFNGRMQPKTMDVECKAVPANKKTEITATFRAPGRQAGWRFLTVNFESEEVSGLSGSGYIFVVTPQS